MTDVPIDKLDMSWDGEQACYFIHHFYHNQHILYLATGI